MAFFTVFWQAGSLLRTDFTVVQLTVKRPSGGIHSLPGQRLCLLKEIFRCGNVEFPYLDENTVRTPQTEIGAHDAPFIRKICYFRILRPRTLYPIFSISRFTTASSPKVAVAISSILTILLSVLRFFRFSPKRKTTMQLPARFPSATYSPNMTLASVFPTPLFSLVSAI